MYRISIIALLLLFTSCTSIASSAVAYTVAKTSEINAKNNKRYSVVDRCVIEESPDAFAVAESIVYGEPLTYKYSRILTPNDENFDYTLPHHVAYAYYTIAIRMGDRRADERRSWLAPYLDKEEKEAIQARLDDRYLIAYLDKCFSIPAEHKKQYTKRERVTKRW